MTWKERVKRFKRASARYGMFFSVWLFERLPYSLVHAIMRLFLGIAFCLTIRQKRIARESLQIAFGPEKSSKEIEQIIKANFDNVGQAMIEMLHVMYHPHAVNNKVVFEGKENLDKALARGKGVLAVTAHFGNFPLMMLYCARMGYKTSCIIRPTRDPVIEEFLVKKRNELGLKTIYAVPRQQCVTESIRALRNNEVVFVLLDQNFGANGGVFVDFFGQKAATATGPVVLARRTGAAILPMFITRQKDDTHKICIEPIFEVEERADEEETLLVNTSRITQLIERYIRRYPYEWGWMHRRWKSRPKEDTLQASVSPG